MFQMAWYDIILMDCQMPEMDGYAASEMIRRLERGERRVAIVAMTAEAIGDARDRCLAAGMDDYIAKPVKLESLAELLRKWARKPTKPDRGRITEFICNVCGAANRRDGRFRSRGAELFGVRLQRPHARLAAGAFAGAVRRQSDAAGISAREKSARVGDQRRRAVRRCAGGKVRLPEYVLRSRAAVRHRESGPGGDGPARFRAVERGVRTCCVAGGDSARDTRSGC